MPVSRCACSVSRRGSSGHALGEQRVRDAVDGRRVEAGVGEDDLVDVARGRVAVARRARVVDQALAAARAGGRSGRPRAPCRRRRGRRASDTRRARNAARHRGGVAAGGGEVGEEESERAVGERGRARAQAARQGEGVAGALDVGGEVGHHVSGRTWRPRRLAGVVLVPTNRHRTARRESETIRLSIAPDLCGRYADVPLRRAIAAGTPRGAVRAEVSSAATLTPGRATGARC